jgi:hypothetical protein
MKKLKPRFTSGPWEAATPMQVWGGDHPICEIERYEWGDTFPSLKLEGNSLDRKVVPFMDIVAYGEIPMDEAKANQQVISAIPDMYHALECALAVLEEDHPDEAATEIVRKALFKAAGGETE